MEKVPRPGPTNYMRVGQDVLELILHESARVPAQLAGCNVAHNFICQKEDTTVCLADNISHVGKICNKDGMSAIEKLYRITCFQGNHPVSNKQHIGFVAGCHFLNYYKNDLCTIGKIQDEIFHWKRKEGMKAAEVQAVLEQYHKRDLEECNDIETEDINDLYRNYFVRIKRLLNGYKENHV